MGKKSKQNRKAKNQNLPAPTLPSFPYWKQFPLLVQVDVLSMMSFSERDAFRSICQKTKIVLQSMKFEFFKIRTFENLEKENRAGFQLSDGDITRTSIEGVLDLISTKSIVHNCVLTFHEHDDKLFEDLLTRMRQYTSNSLRAHSFAFVIKPANWKFLKEVLQHFNTSFLKQLRLYGALTQEVLESLVDTPQWKNAKCLFVRDSPDIFDGYASSLSDMVVFTKGSIGPMSTYPLRLEDVAHFQELDIEVDSLDAEIAWDIIKHFRSGTLPVGSSFFIGSTSGIPHEKIFSLYDVKYDGPEYVKRVTKQRFDVASDENLVLIVHLGANFVQGKICNRATSDTEFGRECWYVKFEWGVSRTAVHMDNFFFR